MNNAGIPTTGFARRSCSSTPAPKTGRPRCASTSPRCCTSPTRTSARWSTQGWGRILTIVSDAGRRGERYPGDLRRGEGRRRWASRAASRPRSVAHGVTVNCIALGTMKTGPLEDAIDGRPRARGEDGPAVPGPAARPSPTTRRRSSALLCSDAGVVDHRPGVPGRRRLRVRPLRRLAPGAWSRPMIPLWPKWAVLALGYGFAPSVQVRACTEAVEGSRPDVRAAWRDELSEQLADHRIDALAIGLAVFGLLSLLAMFSDVVGPIGRGIDTAAAALLGRGKVAGPDRARSRPRRRPSFNGSNDETTRSPSGACASGSGSCSSCGAVVGGFHLGRAQDRAPDRSSRCDHAGGLIGAVIGAPLRAGLGDAGAAIVLVAVGALGTAARRRHRRAPDRAVRRDRRSLRRSSRRARC